VKSYPYSVKISLPPVPMVRPSYLSKRLWEELQEELSDILARHERLQATIKKPDFFTAVAWQALPNEFLDISRRHAYDRALLEAGKSAARSRRIRMAQPGEIPRILNWAELPTEPESQSGEQKNRFIYLIYCVVTNQYYVGQTVHGLARFRQHSADLRAQRHSRQLMQHAWERHARFFVARIIEYVPTGIDLSQREEHWMKLLKPFSYGFNGDSDLSGLARIRDFISPLLAQIATSPI
jgi:hypothetical protein